MNILKAIEDRNLFGSFLGDNLDSWRTWMTALKAVYGLPIKSKEERELLTKCTGRQTNRLNPQGYSTTLFLTGRRSGKSRMAAVVGAYEGVLAGHESKLAKGERGVVLICAPTKIQGRIVKDYIRGIFDTPLLRQEVESESNVGFNLKNGTRIEILSGDYRSVRGFTVVASIVDELCFFGYDSDSKVKSDTELIRALRPSLATVGGKLIGISTPYAMKGWGYKTWKNGFGNDDGKVLVWNCSSRTMNPTLPQSVIDEAMQEDPIGARAEYMGEFRDDVDQFIPRAVVENLVVTDRKELMPVDETQYFAFVDLSGGRGDDATLAIAHKEDRTRVIIDLVRRWRPPFNPHEVCGEMSVIVKRYNVNRVTGDNYAGEFVAEGFKRHELRYKRCEMPKAALYSELLPRLCSGEIELLDDPVMVDQISNLERRTRSGGKDIIDHPPGGHDDVANVVAGVAVEVTAHCRMAGVLN